MKKLVGFIGLAFLPLNGGLQLRGSYGNMAADRRNRFQKRCREMGGTSDPRPLLYAKLRSGDSRHWRYGGMRNHVRENQNNGCRGGK